MRNSFQVETLINRISECSPLNGSPIGVFEKFDNTLVKGAVSSHFHSTMTSDPYVAQNIEAIAQTATGWGEC